MNPLRAFLPVLLLLALGCAGGSRTIPPTPQGEMEAARELFDEGRYFETIQVLTRFLGESPGSRYVDEALLLIGRANYEDGAYFEAEANFRRVISEYPESPWACDSQYHLALALLSQSRKPQLDQSETRAALAQFSAFRSRCPDHALVERAGEHIAAIRERLAEKEFLNARFYYGRRFDDAAIFYLEERVIAEYPETFWSGEAMYLLVQTYRRRHDREGAEADLELAATWARKLLEDHPDTEHAGDVRRFLAAHGDSARAGS